MNERAKCKSLTAASLMFLGGVFFSGAGARAGYKMSGGELVIARNTGDSGGGRAGSLVANLSAAIGETGITSSEGGGIRLHPGYIKLASQPGSIVQITSVSRSTGALELAWISPGSDGFQGDVISGVYRIDYSSDPAHVFSPSVYKLEFSTSVEANRPESLTIDGLEPNTTYYTKIYLGDYRKFFAEDSRRGEKATLANIPVNPVFAGVAACSATITWALPLGGAQDYQLDASSTNFGALYPGGAVKSVSAGDGLHVSLTLTGLAPATTYFFNIASLNRGGERNFTTVMATVTPRGVCFAPCVAGLSMQANPWSRGVSLAWGNPSTPAPYGVLVVLSTSPAVGGIADGLAFNPGQVLNDNSLVRATVAAAGFSDSGLELDTTYFYHLFAQYDGFNYSVSVSTAIFLDLPPTAPAGLATTVDSDRRWVTLNWQPVSSNLDGSRFSSAGTPRPVELAGYRIDRATGIVNANWVTIATVPVSDRFFNEDIPEPERTYFYRIAAVDSIGTEDVSMAIDTEHNLYVLAPDRVTRLKIPPELSKDLALGSGPELSYVTVRAVEELPEVSDKVFASVRFEAVKVPENKVLDRFQFSKPKAEVSLKYEVLGGRVVPAGRPFAASAVRASDAAGNLGIYWNNSEKYVKLFGRVDPLTQTVSVKSSMAGSYQIRSLLRDSGVSFDISGLSNKVITPNGDGLNDTAVFTFNNPKDSGFSGKIFDVEGAFVADMTPGPVSDSLQWNGKRDGRAVSGGVYVYQIRGEEKVFNGTLVVIR